MRKLLAVMALMGVTACAHRAPGSNTPIGPGGPNGPNDPNGRRFGLNEQRPPQLPDTTGWGVHVLALKRAPNGTLWAGTYAEGIYALQGDSTRRWKHYTTVRGDS